MTELLKYQLNEDCIIWAIRFFLGREPVDSDEIEFHKNHDSFNSLRTSFAQAHEFKRFYESVNLKETKNQYMAPLFLMPKEGDTFIHYQYPTLSDSISSLCTYNQFKEVEYANWCEEMAVIPALHRKQWEFVWILSAMKKAGILTEGFRALGFGTGKEPIPSILAKYGLFVTASDAPFTLDIVQGWSSSNQYSQNAIDLWKPEIVTKDCFEEKVTWLPIDMNEISQELSDFDVCCMSVSVKTKDDKEMFRQTAL